VKARKAIFAGSWYPESASECENAIIRFLKKTEVQVASGIKLTGGIVPHAGWYFSGNIACSVIHALSSGIKPDAIVVYGMHLHPASPFYIMTEGAWETPFGEVFVEEDIAKEIAGRFVFDTTSHFSHDNTIELQMPFIRYFFEDVKIIPIGVPPVAASLEIGKSVAQVASRLGVTIKVIGSTDLTHYGMNYGFFPKGTGPAAVKWVQQENDQKIIDAIVSMDPGRVIREALESQNACCAGAAATAIVTAKAIGADRAQCIAYASSYDKSPGESFVGYAGILF